MTSYHLKMSIRGALKNAKKSHLKNMFSRPDGTFLTVEEARDHLMDELSKGHEMLPIGDCDNFDYKTGCKGHTKLELVK